MRNEPPWMLANDKAQNLQMMLDGEMIGRLGNM
jgi:hypothetical protein